MNPVDWALTREVPATAKLLLVGLAWIADDDGVTFKGRDTIATRLGTDTRWVGRYLSVLAENKLITRYRRHRPDGSRTSNLIVLRMPRAKPLDLQNYSGLLGKKEAGDAEPTGDNPPVDLQATIGTPNRRQCAKPTGDNWYHQSQQEDQLGDQQGTDRARTAVNPSEDAPTLQLVQEAPAARRKPTAVGKKPVTRAEHDLCDGILSAFNEAAGAKFSAVGFREKVIRRCRERPDLSLSDHVEMIRRNFAAPWWRDSKPGPEVIYGNDSIFEKSLACDGLPRGRGARRAPVDNEHERRKAAAWERINGRLEEAGHDG